MSSSLFIRMAALVLAPADVRLTIAESALKVRANLAIPPAPRPSRMPAPIIPRLSARGAEIPALGFGTSSLGDCGEVVATALALGYRHIDTAWKYGTERGVGEGIRASGVSARRHFPHHQSVARISARRRFRALGRREPEKSRGRLRRPAAGALAEPGHPAERADAGARKAKRQGLARHVGVANFNIALLDEAIRLCPEPLVNLQAEYHAHLDQTKLVEACRQRGLVFTAYCPLGRGRLLHDPVLADIAARKGRSLAQIAIRWLIQQGNIIPIPRSSNPERIAENLDVFDFTLSDDEMKRIGALKRADGRIANPAGRAPAWD